MRPDETAAKRSAASRSRPDEVAMGSPSDDTTTASFTPGTRSAKFCTSQLRFLASELSSMVVLPVLRLTTDQATGADAARDPRVTIRADRYWNHRRHHGPY